MAPAKRRTNNCSTNNDLSTEKRRKKNEKNEEDSVPNSDLPNPVLSQSDSIVENIVENAINSATDDNKNSANEEPDASGALSMSIEDTNKLRLQLGLAPLEIDDGKSKDITDEFTHVPAKNIAEEKLAEKYREKLKIMKEKREIETKLRYVKQLHVVNEDEAYLDDTSAYVAKMREKSSINSAVAQEEIDKKSHQISSKAVTIEHDQKEFEIGSEAILTLKDADVLDDKADDTLINLNLIETRKARENIKNRTKSSNYNPYDEYDEETGQLKPAELLSKYNEEIFGKNIPKFKIDLQENNILPSDSMTKFMDSVKHLHKESLNSLNSKIAKDYLTHEEYDLKFKKSSKKRTSKRTLTTIPHVIEDSTKDQNHSEKSNLNGLQFLNTPVSIEEDAAASELHNALEKARQSKLRSLTKQESYISNILLKPITNINTPEIVKKDAIVFDSTSEFVRTHDLVPKFQKKVTEPELTIEKVTVKNDSYYGTDSNEVTDVTSKTLSKTNPLAEEPILYKGIGAALSLLAQKGYIEGINKPEVKIQSNIPKTKAIIDRDKMESLYRGNHRKDDFYSNSKKIDKQEYKFDFDLEYYDKTGVPLTPKEAFRDVSHKFHGKRPAKKKQVKRAEQKGERAMDIRSASHEDDIAKTLNIMVEKQKSNQTPFLVLTGSNMNLLASSNIVKQKK